MAEDLPPQVLSGTTSPRMRPSPPTPPLGSNSIALPSATPAARPAVTIDPLPSRPPELMAKPPPPRSLRDLEKQGILAALAATGGNKAQAAVILEIDRSTLYKKLKDYDIES
jgi:transcriptional regulator of acetoin/glycerol metabolism